MWAQTPMSDERRCRGIKDGARGTVTLGAVVIIASPLVPMLTGGRACGVTRVSAKINS